MNVTSVIPKSNEHWLELRANNINSTEISALFGCSPYMTAFELWHLKSGNLKSNFKENQRMTWGKRLQDPIAYGVAEDQGWKIRKRDDYMYSPDLKIGSSFDFAVVDSNPLNGDAALLEIKNVDSLAFKNGWEQLDDGSLDAPLHIELQCAHQMMIADINKLYLVAFVGGNTPVILERDRHPEFERKILQKVSEFWESVKSGVEPKPDFVKDSDVIKDIYSTAFKGKFVEGTPRAHVLAEKYSFLNESIAALNKEKEAVKSELLTIMGDAEKMIGSNFTVSAGMTMRSEYIVKANSFRNFRINYKGD